MTEHAFDALTRSLGRRRAVQALAAAATTLSGVTVAGAKSNNGNNKKQAKKIKKKALDLCAAQVTQCQAIATVDSPQGRCCEELADCDFGGLITCLQAAVAN